MPSETINSILKYASNIRCFAVAAEELVVRNSNRQAHSLPRPKRKQAARRHVRQWKWAIESITEHAKETTYDDLLSQLRVLPLDAVRLAFDPESADATINAMVSEIQLRPNSAIGIWEQIVSDDLAFVWLWNDT